MSTQIIHDEHCIGRIARQAAFDLQWPNHCQECRAHGGSWYSFDPSPRGSRAPSLGPGSMEDFDYLIHFHTRFRHAAHYLGATEDLVRRLGQLEHGIGSKFMANVVAAGITFELAATFEPEPGETIWELEKRLKGLHGLPPRGKGSTGSRARLCPICKGLKRENKPDYAIPLQLPRLRHPRKKITVPEERLPL